MRSCSSCSTSGANDTTPKHFIFALHVHAFIFVVFLLALLLRNLPVLPDVLLLWIPVYVFSALKQVYAQGWGRTLVKGVALGGTYMIALGFGVVLGVIMAAFAI